MGASDSPYRSPARSRQSSRSRSFYDPRILFAVGIVVVAAGVALAIVPFVHETGWKGVLPVLYLTALGIVVAALFSGWARVSFDPEAPKREVEVETKSGWFRKAKQERIPLEDVEDVRMLKVEPRKGATYWQVALTRRGEEPVPIGVPLGLAGAKRWHRQLTQLIDPNSDLPPPPSSSA